MPFDKIGPCPFTGRHWPPEWGEEKITAKKFSCLHSDQKKDLIEYFYEHESAKTSASSQPRYGFPLFKLRDYFGFDQQSVRRSVLQSQEYKAFVAERQRSQAPPPPPEMSLLTAARIAACLAAEPPEEDEATRRAGEYARDRDERERASSAQVVRCGQADRKAAGISFSDGVPRNDGKFVQGGSKHGKLDSLDFGTDKHRAMVCDMQKTIESAVDKKIGEDGDLSSNQKKIFSRLVDKEEQKDRAKMGQVRKDARAPYKARAALGLILLLSSVLW